MPPLTLQPNSAPRRHRCFAMVRAALLALSALLAAPASHAAGDSPPAAAARQQRMVVLPFEFFDTSIDQRPRLLKWQADWLRSMPAQFEQALRKAAPGVRMLDTPGVRRDERELAGDYAHPSSCGPCLLRLGRSAGADYVLSASVRKVSDLILYLQARLIDPRRAAVVGDYTLEVKADNQTMWRRAAQHLARQVARSLAAAG
jgi:hypothetical protein